MQNSIFACTTLINRSMKKILLLVFLFVSFLSHGQITFDKKCGKATQGARGYALAQAASGSYFVVGSKDSHGYVIKLNETGDTLWTKNYGGTGTDYLRTITKITENEYVLTGYTASFGAGVWDNYMVKIDSSGNLLSSKAYGTNTNEGTYAFINTSDGQYLYAGLESHPSANIGLIKTDTSGTVLWAKDYGGTNNEEAFAAVEANDSGYVLAGYTQSYGAGNIDGMVIKTDKNGNMLWVKTYGGAADEKIYSMVKTSGNEYLLLGSTNSFGLDSSDIFVIKIDDSGNIIWSKTYGTVHNDDAFAIMQTPDGGYAICGSVFIPGFGGSGGDMLLVKINSSGNYTWSRYFKLPGFCHEIPGNGICTADSGFALSGATADSTYGVRLTKTDRNGSLLQCNQQSLTITELNAAMQVTTPTITIQSFTAIMTPATSTITDENSMSVVYCAPVGIDEVEENVAVQIYPNPAHNTFTISFNGLSSMVDGQLTIFDVMGRIVHEQTLNNQSTVIDKQFSLGVYFVKVRVGEKEFTEKVMVE
jgi:hypothetical protein